MTAALEPPGEADEADPVARFVARTTRSSGVPRKLEDETAARRIARVLFPR